MANDQIENTKQRLIDKARREAEFGAHYLWSTAGNTPGNTDGAWYRRSKAELHPNVPDLGQFLVTDRNTAAAKYRIHAPMIFSAFANTSDFGLLACTGRAGVFTAPLAVADLDANIHKAFAVKWKALTNDQIDELIENATDPFSYRWPRPNSSLRNDSPHHSTVWGESCIGSRHFDCIGFINWCLSEVLNKPIQYGIGNFIAKSVGKEIPISKAQACDIVTIGAEHIGWISEQNTVIEAKDALSGVVEGPLSASRWTACFRLPDSMWI
jgi:hypothetical protein